MLLKICSWRSLATEIIHLLWGWISLTSWHIFTLSFTFDNIRSSSCIRPFFVSNFHSFFLTRVCMDLKIHLENYDAHIAYVTILRLFLHCFQAIFSTWVWGLNVLQRWNNVARKRTSLPPKCQKKFDLNLILFPPIPIREPRWGEIMSAQLLLALQQDYGPITFRVIAFIVPYLVGSRLLI